MPVCVGKTAYVLFVYTGFLVINQMDTSQAHLSSKAEAAPAKESTKPDNFSRDELTAVLKYGAQKLHAGAVLCSVRSF